MYILFLDTGLKVSPVDKWYILSNLSSPEKIKKIYSQKMGIEAMFKDYKTGGDNSCIS